MNEYIQNIYIFINSIKYIYYLGHSKKNHAIYNVCIYKYIPYIHNNKIKISFQFFVYYIYIFILILPMQINNNTNNKFVNQSLRSKSYS
jgi:hypothetical protein